MSEPIQVKFIDGDGLELGGILFDNKYIICGCCGGLLSVDDVTIIKEYKNWINISGEIIGE